MSTSGKVTAPADGLRELHQESQSVESTHPSRPGRPQRGPVLRPRGTARQLQERTADPGERRVAASATVAPAPADPQLNEVLAEVLGDWEDGESETAESDLTDSHSTPASAAGPVQEDEEEPPSAGVEVVECLRGSGDSGQLGVADDTEGDPGVLVDDAPAAGTATDAAVAEDAATAEQALPGLQASVSLPVSRTARHRRDRSTAPQVLSHPTGET